MDPILPIAPDEVPAGHGPPRGPAPAAPLAKPLSRGLAVALFGMLVAIVAIAWFDARGRGDAVHAEVTKRLLDQDATLAQAKARDSDRAGELREAQARMALLETRIAELQAQQASLDAQYQDLAPSRDDVVLSDVEQMLLLASQQLALAANVPAALAALQLADNRLAGTNRTQWTPLRRALGQDMDRLRAVPNVDAPGIAVALDRALASIDALPLAMDERVAEPGPLPPPRDEPAWRAFLRSSWSGLKSLVRIEVADRAVPPLVPPAQQYYLRENLRLRLLSARVALLSRDQASFKADITAANVWVKQYFDTRAKPVQAVTATLTQLGATVMPSDLPDVNASLTALRTVKASRERSGVRAASAPGRVP
jgi:uroporphyrin-III C-methyltransferase